MAEEEIGHVTHYFPKIGVAVVEITAGSLKIGETIRIKGHTSDFTQSGGITPAGTPVGP